MHSFDPKIAEMVGIAPAVIYQNIVWWIAKNEANEQNKYDGYYWTYNSVKAFSTLFPYLTEKQIRTSLDKLVEVGAIVVGNYNKSAYDRTKWFRLGGQLDLPCGANGNASEGQPIPDVKPDIKPDRLDTNVSNKPKRKCRIKPDWALSEDEWNYASSKGLSQKEIEDEADKFRDHYLSSGSTWLDWSLVWKRWVRESIKRREAKGWTQRSTPNGSQPLSRADIQIRRIKEAKGFGDGWGT